MEPLFEVRNLTVGYDVPLVEGITFTARCGEIIGILGRNGCGKTTLLRGLSGGIRHFSGQVLAAGKDLAAMKPREQATHISVLPQQTEILEGISARQVIEMGRYPHGGLFHRDDREKEPLIQKNAALLGITHLLEVDCARLSQGQRQLVLLCRLLVQDTPVMLLDEPNAALDYDNTFAMFRILREVVKTQQKTALLVLHDPELALAHCHRLLILKDGKLCRDLCLDQGEEGEIQEALQKIYPQVVVRKDPFDGAFRCYHQETEDSLC